MNYFVEDYVSDEPKAFFTRDHVDCDAMAILTGAALVVQTRDCPIS